LENKWCISKAVRWGTKSSVEKGQGMRAEGGGGSKTLQTAQGIQLGAGRRCSKRKKEGTDLKKLSRRLLLLFFKRIIKKPIDSNAAKQGPSRTTLLSVVRP